MLLLRSLFVFKCWINGVILSIILYNLFSTLCVCGTSKNGREKQINKMNNESEHEIVHLLKCMV